MLRKETRKAKLLKLIYDIGGEATREQINARVPEYWELSKQELEIESSSGKPLYWHHVSSICQAIKDRDHYLENPRRGVWKINEAGKRELARLGLIDKRLPISGSVQGNGDLTSSKPEKRLTSEDEEIMELVLEEIAPNGPKQFPADFLDNKDCADHYEVELRGTHLQLAPYSTTVITSPRGHFRYEAKNPPAAKYILYAHEVGLKKVKIPRDNFTLFNTVTGYEKYCKEVSDRAFELFLEFTYDEDRAKELTTEIARRLGLKSTLFNSQNSLNTEKT